MLKHKTFCVRNITRCYDSTGITEGATSDVNTCSTPAHCLRLPGKRLNLTALLYAKKFRFHGYKQGALSAFKELEEAELGILETTKAKGFVLITQAHIHIIHTYMYINTLQVSFHKSRHSI